MKDILIIILMGMTNSALAKSEPRKPSSVSGTIPHIMCVTVVQGADPEGLAMAMDDKVLNQVNGGWTIHSASQPTMIEVNGKKAICITVLQSEKH